MLIIAISFYGVLLGAFLTGWAIDVKERYELNKIRKEVAAWKVGR